MRVELEPDEIPVLLEVLSNYLSDLRMEIVDTEQHDMREELKQTEVILKRIIARLQQATATPLA